MKAHFRGILHCIDIEERAFLRNAAACRSIFFLAEREKESGEMVMTGG